MGVLTIPFMSPSTSKGQKALDSIDDGRSKPARKSWHKNCFFFKSFLLVKSIQPKYIHIGCTVYQLIILFMYFFCYLCWGFSGIEEMSHVLCNCRLLDRAWLLEQGDVSVNASSWIHKYILHTFVSFTFFYIAKRHFLNTLLRYPYGSWLGWAQKAICSCCRSAAEPRSNLTSTTTFVSIDMHIS